MTKGEAMALETEKSIFPMNFGQENKEVILVEEAAEETSVELKSINNNIHSRFARLKKSLRKRSISIL